MKIHIIFTTVKEMKEEVYTVIAITYDSDGVRIDEKHELLNLRNACFVYRNMVEQYSYYGRLQVVLLKGCYILKECNITSYELK